MPWGPRVAETSLNIAEGDKLYVFGQYNGPSGQLTMGMPLYKDVSDSAEYNAINTTTKLTAFSGGFPTNFTATNPPQTAGRVTLSTIATSGITPGGSANINAGAISTGSIPVFVGAYSPTNPTDRPSTGDVVRITRFGITPIQVSAGVTPAVGDYITVQQASPFFGTVAAPLGISTGFTPGQAVGRVTATAGFISAGQVITPVPFAASSTPGYLEFLVNAWVDK